MECPLNLDPELPTLGEPLRIVYQDEHLCVVYKPAGLMVHRGQGADRHEPFLLQLLRDQLGSWVTPVHRLDRPTSGLVVFALHHQAAADLSEQWREGRVSKTYEAIVRGWFPGKMAAHSLGLEYPWAYPWTIRLGQDPWDRSTYPAGISGAELPQYWNFEQELADPENGTLRSAQSQMRPLAQIESDLPVGPYATARFTWMELRPITGRWHQLRRHLAHLAHPILGDTVHGCRHNNHGVQEALGWWRLMLNAVKIELEHPVDRRPLCFEAPREWGLAVYWQELRKRGVT